MYIDVAVDNEHRKMTRYVSQLNCMYTQSVRCRSQSHRELEGILPQRSANQSNFVGHGGGFRAGPPLPSIGHAAAEDL